MGGLHIEKREFELQKGRISFKESGWKGSKETDKVQIPELVLLVLGLPEVAKDDLIRTRKSAQFRDLGTTGFAHGMPGMVGIVGVGKVMCWQRGNWLAHRWSISEIERRGRL